MVKLDVWPFGLSHVFAKTSTVLPFLCLVWHPAKNKEKQYFTCKPQDGLFVRPQNIVQAGSDATAGPLIMSIFLPFHQVLDGKLLRRKSNSASLQEICLIAKRLNV